MKRKHANDEASSSFKRNNKGWEDEVEEEVQIDRISNLPDSVLARILSFLPTQDAVKTSLLRRFGLLWATSDNIHIDACSFHDCVEPKYDEKAPRSNKSQRLAEKEMRLANTINTWTRFAIRREVQVLDLDFMDCYGSLDLPGNLYKIPDFVFNCDSIRELKYPESRLEISGPNIISLDISSSVGQVDLKNLSSLKDAALGFMYRFSSSEDKNHEAMKILENLNSAKVLTIHKQSIQLWTAWELMKISFPSIPQKHLILDTDLSKEHLPGIVGMLRSSPSLEMLDMHIVKTYFTFPDFLKRALAVESYWSKLDESPQDLPHNLQTVTIHGSVAEPFVVQLVQFLLKNLFGLEKMVITSKRRSNGSDPKSCVTSDELLELFQKLLSFPRASSSAVVLLY
ncbi:unnamed protein product [Dovyalis caffra]|uniref:F-box domain-containing protein n=1 Tax=Dovyalis caffra TaxID=77055 RepID=A0AAV1SHF7_9ROSI|nr:unnamed protein product [Dovyalis caffra]